MKIWNVEKGELINTIQGQTISISADGKYLAMSFESYINIWNLEKGCELINRIDRGQIYSVAFSADGQYFATGSLDSTCKIWNVEKGYEEKDKKETD